LENQLIENIQNLFGDYYDFFFWLGIVSSVIFLVSLLSIGWLVSLIPSDYFINKKESKFKLNYPVAWIVSVVIKNIFGYILIFGGILMLILPGQGLITIFVGLLLSNYPGKYSIEKRIIATPKILKSINWLRKRSNEPPLII
tara:strand:+ start:874 stop:1299 length:426 start_codon:yes stop_codon:yes gene_type:complete